LFFNASEPIDPLLLPLSAEKLDELEMRDEDRIFYSLRPPALAAFSTSTCKPRCSANENYGLFGFNKSWYLRDVRYLSFSFVADITVFSSRHDAIYLSTDGVTSPAASYLLICRFF
jgi:hypothetical protein